MKALIDTNVVLDILLHRQPWYDNSAMIFGLADENLIKGYIYQALDLDWNDFEDSVQYIVGESFSADYIITRNTQDFSSSSIPAITPEQFMERDIQGKK